MQIFNLGICGKVKDRSFLPKRLKLWFCCCCPVPNLSSWFFGSKMGVEEVRLRKGDAAEPFHTEIDLWRPSICGGAWLHS